MPFSSLALSSSLTLPISLSLLPSPSPSLPSLLYSHPLPLKKAHVYHLMKHEKWASSVGRTACLPPWFGTHLPAPHGLSCSHACSLCMPATLFILPKTTSFASPTQRPLLPSFCIKASFLLPPPFFCQATHHIACLCTAGTHLMCTACLPVCLCCTVNAKREQNTTHLRAATDMHLSAFKNIFCTLLLHFLFTRRALCVRSRRVKHFSLLFCRLYTQWKKGLKFEVWFFAFGYGGLDVPVPHRRATIYGKRHALVN